MPRRLKLTWQAGTDHRSGRWRKKFKGRVYYFAGGRGKTDRDGYDAALAEWEKKKVRIDAAAPKPHQVDYEQAISKWEEALTWCRQNGEDKMADVAMEKSEKLRRSLTATKPQPVPLADTFEGQFERSVRNPAFDSLVNELALVGEEMTRSTVFGPNAGGVVENGEFVDDRAKSSVGSGIRTVVVPLQSGLHTSDPLALEKEVWRDRLNVMRRSKASPDDSLTGYVKEFIQAKQDSAMAGSISFGRVEKLQSQLSRFRDWMGGDTPVAEINSKCLLNYRALLMQELKPTKGSSTTAHDKMGGVKSFVRWLWETEAISTLPRVLDPKSKTLTISKSTSEIVTYTNSEIRKILLSSSDRTQLYILLMLNCGMTQKDLADLHSSEVDWKLKRITRKRSKTRQHDNVPTVGYKLWPETYTLLCKERNPVEAGLVLLNDNGSPLWREERGEDGKYKKNDNVKNAFERVRKKTNIAKSLKSLKKSSASLIKGHKSYKGLEDLFLGHAPQTMADKHYARAPEILLDEAVTWLREKYDIKGIFSSQVTDDSAAAEN